MVRVDKEKKLRVPLHLLESIVCFGRISCSPPLMGRCGARGIGISFLTSWGKFLAKVQGPTSGNVLLRREQYRRSDSKEASASIAQSFLAAKIANCRSVLQRRVRDYPDHSGTDDVVRVVKYLGRRLLDLDRETRLDSMRGLEGDCARAYFGVFDHFLVQQKAGFAFEKRTRRPPKDSVNALLSFLYTMLRHDVTSALEVVGLDPQVGFLHRDRPGRPGLALDMMEELRAVVADRLAVSLINRKQVKASGFEKGETGAVLMNKESRKLVLAAYQEKKAEILTHPFLEEKITVGLLPHLQARLFARYLRGDLDGYPPFFVK